MNTRFAGKTAGSIAKRKWGTHWFVGVGKGEQAFSHRVVWKLMTGNEPQEEIDHANCDGLDNRWINLRLANHAENGQNAVKPLGIAGVKGVHKNGKRWRAQITSNKKRIHLGYFDTEDQAHMAYAAAAAAYHGAFMQLQGKAV